MIEFIIFICVLVLVMVVSRIYRKKEYEKTNSHYDERQLLIRSKASQISCYTVILINIFYALFFYGITKDFVSPQIIILTSAFIGIGIDVVYCIVKDAYIMVGQNVKKWITVMIIVISVNIASACMNFKQGIQQDGYITGFYANLSIVILFSVILISLIVKIQIDKKGDEYEES